MLNPRIHGSYGPRPTSDTGRSFWRGRSKWDDAYPKALGVSGLRLDGAAIRAVCGQFVELYRRLKLSNRFCLNEATFAEAVSGAFRTSGGLIRDCSASYPDL